jgi:ribosomal protein S18 acetylase RimI-like enzyme
VTGADEGLAVLAEHDESPVAMMIAQPDVDRGTYHLLDLRIDYEFRRQGLGTVLAYQLISAARDRELRAVSAETQTSNFPGNQLLVKLGFMLSGVDTRRWSKHDIVMESATLLWYMPLD